MKKFVSLSSLVFLSPLTTSAIETNDQWGAALYFRTASIPYVGLNNDSKVSTLFPAIYFKNEHFFIDGTQAGYKFYATADKMLSANAILRARFIDLPKELQNAHGGDTADYGIQLSNGFSNGWGIDAELMATNQHNLYANLRLKTTFQALSWTISPALTTRIKSADFNTEHFSKPTPNVNLHSGIDVKADLSTQYEIAPNVYLIGKAGIEYLDNSVVQSPTINNHWQTEFYFGVGFFTPSFEQENIPSNLTFLPQNKQYLRFAHGLATPSDISEVVRFNTQDDPYNNQLSSIFYGTVISEDLFSYPLDIYFTSGFVKHWSSEVQTNSNEYVVALKGYWTYDWPSKWRLGIAQGLSYIDDMTYIEASEMQEKGYRSSNTMNYLDLSIDVNIGDLLNYPKLNNIWLGYSLHHRSAIFESSSWYGRIKGGSNYNTLYVQYDFN